LPSDESITPQEIANACGLAAEDPKARCHLANRKPEVRLFDDWQEGEQPHAMNAACDAGGS